MVSKTKITNKENDVEVLYLGQVCSLLEHRNKGVGGELIRTAIEKGRKLGYKAIFLQSGLNLLNP